LITPRTPALSLSLSDTTQASTRNETSSELVARSQNCFSINDYETALNFKQHESDLLAVEKRHYLAVEIYSAISNAVVSETW